MNHNTHCCVETCSNTYDPDSDIRFFELPLENQTLLDDWINAIGCEDFFMLSQNSYVCSDHFTENDYVMENGFCELSSTAIPSIFNFKNSDESSNVVETTIDFNENNTIQNWNSSFPINNIDTQANSNKKRCHTSSTISNKTVVINGCVKNTNSLSNTSKINHDEIANNNKSSINNLSQKYDDLFFWDIDRGDEAENISTIINIPYNSVSHASNTAKTVISNKFITKLRPMWNRYKASRFKQQKVSDSYLKILRSYGRKNKRLQSKVKELLSRKIDLLDVKVKHFQLIRGVLETELQLLLNGIDTTGYSAFRIAYEDLEMPKSKDIECDVVIECKLKELKNSHIDNNSMTSPKCPTQFQPSTESDTVIILH